jgi:hypothetical protein
MDGQVNPQELAEAIEREAEKVRDDNPALADMIITDSSGVWLRDGGTDFGIIQRTIDDHLLYCYENGSTVVHRPSPGAS